MVTEIDSLTNLIWLVENDGYVSIGQVGPIRCAAVASDEHNQLAALAKKPQESVAELLIRLDKAVEVAWSEEVFADEINE